VKLWQNQGKKLNDSSSQAGLKKHWTLTGPAFAHLLRWLDEGTDSGGARYLAMRSRLATYFDRKNCNDPDVLADEVLNRVGRRLEEEGNVETESPAKYCYTVARFVFMEQLRSPASHEVAIEDLVLKARDDQADTVYEREAAMDCLERCAGSIDQARRSLIIRYYSGEKGEKIANRKLMADELGVTLNALAIRAFRIRESLEACLAKCLAAKERN
jgi:DNA-directed RNA polymerase specialized sigma24 family protein